MDNKVILGYWGFRGFEKIPRLLLTYTGKQWEQKNYTDGNEWFGNLNLGLDFPNLLYVIDGDFKLCQSSPIERYIIERSGNKELLGKKLLDQAKINEILGFMVDIRTNSVPLFFDKDYEGKLKGKWDATIKPKLDNLQKFIGNKQNVLGYLTLADFYISQYLSIFKSSTQKNSRTTLQFIESLILLTIQRRLRDTTQEKMQSRTDIYQQLQQFHFETNLISFDLCINLYSIFKSFQNIFNNPKEKLSYVKLQKRAFFVTLFQKQNFFYVLINQN